ncbi:ABC transporter, permease protein [Leptospira ryugenii]|uniref:ABC transporter, permease protein n=1 Tax=Leptospira ryugenii TaxID=1917863 RepID=A0A2P2E4L5_9LEPT|nr:ABC transporter permease [Leptospira ryugenii]GBF51802.1 ABC transporter, permease protein [Leptospira ryugenii]
MKSELTRFLLFFILLSICASTLASFRSTDKQYLYADAGLSNLESSIKTNQLGTFFSNYKSFLNSLVFASGQTDSGESIYHHISQRLLPTFHLALFAVLFGAGLGILLSLFTLHVESQILASTLKRISELILSTPIFVFAVLFLILFFYQWELLPPGGYESLNTYYVILPGVTLGIRIFARIYLFQVSEIWKEVNTAYVNLLKTRQYPWTHIVYVEIFRKVLPFTMILVFLDFGSLVSGAMIVEEIFFFPGIGKSMYYSIKSMDRNLLATLLLYVGLIFYFVNRTSFHWQKSLMANKESSFE